MVIVMNNYLYETIETLKKYANINIDLPNIINDNLNPKFELRKYQIEAFKNFIFYYTNENLKVMPFHLLFHMATGSGKTLMMAGLILYLYQQGYRNFLFFVNSTTILEKTKDNFLNNQSGKYLFNKTIEIDSKKVNIREVTNFQGVNKDDINICFTTIQGLHNDINFVKENRLSLDDFKLHKTVFISDEAHHINALTNNKLSSEEEDLKKSWEHTIDNLLLPANKENILLEFTATCDLDNSNIKEKYQNKIIYNYPLSRFREDGFSKEVDTLQSNVDLKTKMIQAILISQYRLKLFQLNKIDIKPVVLFKSDNIENCRKNYNEFVKIINNLKKEEILSIKENSTSKILVDMFAYFENFDISIDNLIKELKDDFSKDKCLVVNSKETLEDIQLIVNSLEDKNNLYRTIFEVKMLDEGWDVLNLFDIVRLYETRDGNNGKPGKKTIQEAQLIGRGARYCPFSLNNGEKRYIRKYDDDIKNPLRICETLLYHCQMESRYISELKIALKETGIIPKESISVQYTLKDSFKNSDFYKNGWIFSNEKILKSRKEIKSIPQNIKNEIFEFVYDLGETKQENLFDEKLDYLNLNENKFEKSYTINELADNNYNLVLCVLRKFNIFKFSNLKTYFPNLTSTKEFITSKNYLGDIKFIIKSIYEEPNNYLINKALYSIFSKLKDNIITLEEVYEGVNNFQAKKFNEIFIDKVININNPYEDSVGISQNMVNDDSYRMDLSNEDWYVYNDNYGTTEEKKLVKYFSKFVKELKEKYTEVYLVRNERTLPIYSFSNGERFEPDFILVLIDKINKKQYQVFLEAKGTQLLLLDKEKEEFLIELNSKAIPIKKFKDDYEYFVLGFPFFNQDNKITEFNEYMKKIID